MINFLYGILLAAMFYMIGVAFVLLTDFTPPGYVPNPILVSLNQRYNDANSNYSQYASQGILGCNTFLQGEQETLDAENAVGFNFFQVFNFVYAHKLFNKWADLTDKCQSRF